MYQKISNPNDKFIFEGNFRKTRFGNFLLKVLCYHILEKTYLFKLQLIFLNQSLLLLYLQLDKCCRIIFIMIWVLFAFILEFDQYLKECIFEWMKFILKCYRKFQNVADVRKQFRRELENRTQQRDLEMLQLKIMFKHTEMAKYITSNVQEDRDHQLMMQM